MNDKKKTPEEVKEYLAKIRKTIAESEELIAAAELRRQETDRLLARQGLTREQVRNIKVSPEQKRLVNEELRRRGLPIIEENDADYNFDAATAELRASSSDPALTPDEALAARQRRFGTLMHDIRL